MLLSRGGSAEVTPATKSGVTGITPIRQAELMSKRDEELRLVREAKLKDEIKLELKAELSSTIAQQVETYSLKRARDSEEEETITKNFKRICAEVERTCAELVRICVETQHQSVKEALASHALLNPEAPSTAPAAKKKKKTSMAVGGKSPSRRKAVAKKSSKTVAAAKEPARQAAENGEPPAASVEGAFATPRQNPLSPPSSLDDHGKGDLLTSGGSRILLGEPQTPKDSFPLYTVGMRVRIDERKTLCEHLGVVDEVVFHSRSYWISFPHGSPRTRFKEEDIAATGWNHAPRSSRNAVKYSAFE